jgi:hypothetical protein
VAYCWQNDCSAAKASKVLFGPGATGIIGTVGGATQALRATITAVAPAIRGSICFMLPRSIAQDDLAVSFALGASCARPTLTAPYTLAPSDEACRHDDDSMTAAH